MLVLEEVSFITTVTVTRLLLCANLGQEHATGCIGSTDRCSECTALHH